MKTTLTLIGICIACFAWWASADAAPQTAPATAPQTAPADAPAKQPADIRLTLAPGALADPPLKYLLAPAVIDQTPGNAAPLYLQGFMLQHDAGELLNVMASQYGNKMDELLKAPRQAFSPDEAESVLWRFGSTLSLIKLGARREYCEWNSEIREKSLDASLGILNTSRNAAQLLALRARKQIAQGHFDDAIDTLQTGFVLVSHMKNDAPLVQGLVAMGITSLMLDRVEEFIQTPGSPNLYWALANLPRPLADMRTLARLDRSWLDLLAPEFQRDGSGRISAERLQAMIRQIRELSFSRDAQDNARQKREIAAFMTSAQKPARAWLAAHGYTEEQLNQLPADQSVSLYLIQTYRLASDEVFAYAALPYWQAADGYRKATESLPAARERNPLLGVLPALSHVHRQIALTERRLAFLQTAEALRGYAAAHAGKLPPSLDDLSETPAPQDPVTGKPFIYEAAGNTATLRSQAPAQREYEQSGVYRITMTAGKAKL